MSVCWLIETDVPRRLKHLMNSFPTSAQQFNEVTPLELDNIMAEIAIQALRSRGSLADVIEGSDVNPPLITTLTSRF